MRFYANQQIRPCFNILKLKKTAYDFMHMDMMSLFEKIN